MAFKARVGASNFPAANDTLYFYEAGTTTLISGIYDPDTLIPISNPFTVPVHGWYSFELPSPAYVDIWWEEGNSYLITNYDFYGVSNKDNPFPQYILIDDESDPVFTAWDKSTGIVISKSQITDFEEPQQRLESSFNIKTINGQSILGSGNLTVIASLPDETDPIFNAWDKSTGITITESQITDLRDYQPLLVSGTNIKTINGQSVLGEGDLNVNMEISETDPVFTAWDKTSGISISVSQIIDFEEPQELLIPFINIKNIDNQELMGGGDLILSLDINETDPVFTAWDKSTGITITESQITDLGDYQDLLVSGTNIKTINGNSILGDGNLNVTPNETDPIFSAWDKSTGIVIFKNQITDFGVYQPLLISGSNIKKINGESILGFGDLNVIPNEADPIFTAWDKSTGITITESQITDLGDYQEELISGTNICTINNNILLGDGDLEIGAIPNQSGEELVNGIDEYLGSNTWQNRSLGNRTNTIGGLLKTCMGNSIDDSWLECNGDIKREIDYPLLYPMMTPYEVLLDGFSFTSESNKLVVTPSITYTFDISRHIYSEFSKYVNIIKNNSNEYVALINKQVFKSVDSINWEFVFDRSMYTLSYIQLDGNIHYINGKYYILGLCKFGVEVYDGVFVSNDLLNWEITKITNRTANLERLIFLNYFNGVLVGVGEARKYYDTYYDMYRPTNSAYYSTDFGITWNPCSGMLGYHLSFVKVKICTSINKIIAFGNDINDSDDNKTLAISSDGINWAKYNAVSGWLVIDFDWSDSLSLGVVIVKYGKNVSIRVSSNGINWSSLGVNITGNYVTASNVVWNEDLGKFFIFSSNGSFLYFSEDGYNWTRMDYPIGQELLYGHYWDSTSQKYITYNGSMTWGLEGFYLPNIPSIDREVTYIKAK